jgi:hypothetical protein
VIALLAQAAAGGGVLDDMLNEMTLAGTRYEASSFQLGLGLFAVLSSAGFALYFWRYSSSHGGSLHGIEEGLLEGVKAIAIPFTVMLAVGQILPNIIAFATSIGSTITGAVAPITGPTAIAVLGMNLAIGIVGAPLLAFQAVANVGQGGPVLLGAMPGVSQVVGAAALAAKSGDLLASALSTIIAIPLAVFVVICFAIIAAQWMLAVAEVVLVIGSGAFLMGTSAAPGTAPFSERYYGAVVGAVMRFVTIVIVVGFISATTHLWGQYLADTNIAHLLPNWFKIILGSTVCTILAWQLPVMAQGAFGGQPILTGGAAMGVARSAASTVRGAMSAGGGAGGGGASKPPVGTIRGAN